MARPSASIRVDRPTMQDLDALVDLWVALVADQRAHDTHLLAEENRSTARDVLSQYVATERVFVARDPVRDAPVGFVMYHVESGLYAEDVQRGVVDNVYVEGGYRSAGVGSRLLDAAEDDLRGAGADVLGISVMAGNDRARALYESRGYTVQRYVMEKPTESDTQTKGDGE
ncbi:GNAT family N-acetyltransferase [Halarchaeum grantii]|nr:GNAT family N-acetyltransferase [Halarchaeum grantii]